MIINNVVGRLNCVNILNIDAFWLSLLSGGGMCARAQHWVGSIELAGTLLLAFTFIGAKF